MAKTSSVKTNTDEDFTEKEDAKEETSEMRYERLKRREEDYYYKHFAEQVYSRGLLEEHFALYDLALTEPDEVQGCCPACCHNVRRTCFIFGFVTTLCWLPLVFYLVISYTTGTTLHDSAFGKDNSIEGRVFVRMLASSFLLDLLLSVLLIVGAKRGVKALGLVHVALGSVQVFLFFTEGILAGFVVENNGQAGVEATVYLLLFTVAAVRTLYFTIESYGLYLTLVEIEEKKRMADAAAARMGPRATALLAANSKVVPDIRVT